MRGPPYDGNLAGRGSKNPRGEANVYIKMKLFGKEILCLLDSGCDTAIVPKKLIDRFRRLEIKLSAQSVLAANDTPIRSSGESDLPFVLEERCI